MKPGRYDKKHFISGIDYTPTVLDVLGLLPLEGMDGRSFLPILKGGSQEGRESVVTHINTIASKRSYAMRSVQTAKYGYIYNAWADGKTRFKNESQKGLTMNAMIAAAETDEALAARLKDFLYRTKEEFYDYENDPDALRNIIDDPTYADEIAQFRRLMLKDMKASNDNLIRQFQDEIKQIF